MGRGTVVLQARQEFDRLIEALQRDLFDVEASGGLMRWLVDLQPRARQAWYGMPRRRRAPTARLPVTRPPRSHTDQPEDAAPDG